MFYKFIYLFSFGCVGSSFLCEGFLQLWQAGATLHRGARASHCCSLSCCGAQAPDTQAQQLWLTGPAAPRHVGSSQTRARTRVPCISRQILNHCATREAPRFAPMMCFNQVYKVTDVETTALKEEFIAHSSPEEGAGHAGPHRAVAGRSRGRRNLGGAGARAFIAVFRGWNG